jgi:hypothetical protein
MRRSEFLGQSFCISTLFYLGFARSVSALDFDQGSGDLIMADEWMLKWIEKEVNSNPKVEKKAPFGALHIGRFADRMYYLTSVIGWKPTPLEPQFPHVVVPVGFVTDLTSIPRAFWSLMDPSGDYSHAAVVHDYMYWEQFTTRDTADELFRLHMERLGIDILTRNFIFSVVRAGGQGAWDKNKIAKEKGEKRLLIRQPTDPLITWKSWKMQPGVFAN